MNDEVGQLALRMNNNVNLGRPILFGMDHFDAYGDLTFHTPRFTLEMNRYFAQIDQEYPNSKFILNTRDVDNWIKSRAQHIGRNGNKPMLAHFKSILGTDKDQDVFDAWRNSLDAHVKEVRSYFDGRDNFLEFNIEKDDPFKIKDFLEPDFTIDLAHWAKKNQTAGKTRINRL